MPGAALIPCGWARIHTPPPSSNEVMHLAHSQGFPANALYAAIRVSGHFEANGSRQTVGYARGPAPAHVACGREPVEVQNY